MAIAENQSMQETAGPLTDRPELEIDEKDIVCYEPMEGMRSAIRLRYRRLNAFLGDYISRLRRGESMLMTAPRDAHDGDVIDVDIAIDGHAPFVLHAQIVAVWAGQARVKFVIGKLTDRIVAPIIEGALGPHLARALLG
jgi:hypothetical protein